MSPAEVAWPWMFVALVAAVGLMIAFSRTRKKAYLAGMLLALLGVGLAWMIDEAVVTPKEQVVLAVQDVVDAFRAKDLPRLESRISPQIPEFQRMARENAERFTVEDVRITDLNVNMLAQNSRAETKFRVNGSIREKTMGMSSHQPTMWAVKWQQEEGQWKLFEVQRLDPITQQPQELLAVPRS